jgi:hypothetical protein
MHGNRLFHRRRCFPHPSLSIGNARPHRDLAGHIFIAATLCQHGGLIAGYHAPECARCTDRGEIDRSNNTSTSAGFEDVKDHIAIRAGFQLGRLPTLPANIFFYPEAGI